jgi:hypothetical protein
MSMGNYLRHGLVDVIVMAISKTPLEIQHPTVVPANFDPETGDRATADESPSDQ